MAGFITGQRDTVNVTQAQRRIDMEEKIFLLEPDSTPLTLFSSKLPKKGTHNPEFKWAEDILEPRFTTISGTATNTATTINVAATTGDYFSAGAIAKIPSTGEVVRVVSVATDALTVVRGVGSPTAGTGVALVGGEEIVVIGIAAQEGADVVAGRSINPTVVTNYTQIQRDVVDMTGTQMSTDQFTKPHDWTYQVKKKGIEHAKSLEYGTLRGKAYEDVSGTHPRRTTNGADKYITTNITAVGGTLTEASFWAAIRAPYRYGSKQKVGFAAPLVVSVLNQYPQGRIQTRQGEDTYGLAVLTYISPFGTLHLMNHWLFEGVTWGKQLMLLDMSQIKYRFLANENGSRDTHIRENIQAPGVDGRTDEYMSEIGLEFGLEKTHALLTGITG